ncbi:MAG TPA: OmpA family protein [Bryobacteraceae bacterium]|nr:OmpA family protein [Bryobacteraceae bacterium]
MNVWLAFADFFCAVGLLMLGAYGKSRTEAWTYQRQLEQQQARNPVIEINEKARTVIQKIYEKLKKLNVEYDPDKVSIGLPDSILSPYNQPDIINPEVVGDLAKALNEVDQEIPLREFSFVLTGYTDDHSQNPADTGPDSYNMKLSRARAAAVEAILLKSIDPSRIQVSIRAMGPREPRVDNCNAPNPDGKPRYDCWGKGMPLKGKNELQKNRRVELSIGIYSAAIAVQPRPK